MKADQRNISTGDWVYFDSPGIWRVERVVQGTQKLRFSLQERKRVNRVRLVFCKRIVNESWNPAFSIKVDSDDFICPLPGDDQIRLDRYLETNPKVLKDFEAFQPAMIDLAMDLPLNVPVSVGRLGIQRLINEVFVGIEDKGFTNDEILERIAQSELVHYNTQGIRNATLRFLSKGHEIQNNEYIFREVQLLMV